MHLIVAFIVSSKLRFQVPTVIIFGIMTDIYRCTTVIFTSAMFTHCIVGLMSMKLHLHLKFGATGPGCRCFVVDVSALIQVSSELKKLLETSSRIYNQDQLPQIYPP